MTHGTSSRATSAKPLHATARDLSRPSEGAQVDVIARTLGTPLIPWQRDVVDVATERRPDGSYEYQVVVVSVPRQTGKTTLLRALGTHRSLVRGRDVFYTAQTGKDARARWMDLVKTLRVNPALKSRAAVALRGGSEHVGWPNGSVFQVFAPTPESLHGYTPPLVMIDEAFAQFGQRGDLLMGAIGPAQFTIVDKQLWIVSTAGTADSTFLHDWIDRAIDGTPRVAGFIYGATDDQDVFDLEDIAAFHPGVGQRLNGKLLTAADVLAEADKNSRAEYERAFGNRRTVTLSHLIPSETWRSLAVDDLATPAAGVELRLAYDVSADRQRGAILAAWTSPAGLPCVRVVRAQEGTRWMPAAVDELRRELAPVEVVAVGHGPVLEVTERLRARYPSVAAILTVLGEREFAAACGAFLSLIDDAGLGHGDQDELNRSVVGLVTRPAVSDGVAFSRRHSVGDSSPGIAAAIAAARTTTGPVQGSPMVYFGGAA